MPSTVRVLLPDIIATQDFAIVMESCLCSGCRWYLHGELGAGKTTLVRALLHAAGYVGKVSSPTYTLFEMYQTNKNGQPLYWAHFDLYRLLDPHEFLEVGFRECFNAQTICLVEWPEKGSGVLPTADLHGYFTSQGMGRELLLQARTQQGHACLQQLSISGQLPSYDLYFDQ